MWNTIAGHNVEPHIKYVISHATGPTVSSILVSSMRQHHRTVFPVYHNHRRRLTHKTDRMLRKLRENDAYGCELEMRSHQCAEPRANHRER